MASPEYKRYLPAKELVFTNADLVKAFKTRPPELFKGAEAVVDLTGMVSSRKHRNLFNLPRMGKRVDDLLKAEGNSVLTKLAVSDHFGFQYAVETRTANVYDVPVAQSATYTFLEQDDMPPLHQAMLRPYETSGLYGFDADGKSVAVELTQYRGAGHTKADVYKITTTKPSKKPETVIFVEHPGWHNNYQSLLAERLHLEVYP